MKKAVGLLLAGAMLLLCSACGIIQQATQIARDERGREYSSASFDLPPLPENTMVPEEEEELDEENEAFFETMVDTEGLLQRQKAIGIDEIGEDYIETEDGYYIKSTPFMGRDGIAELAFNIGGANQSVSYYYEKSFDGITAEQVIKEYERLSEAITTKYGKVSTHQWYVSPTGRVEELYPIGEFDNEEIRDSFNRRETALFHHTWNRVGGSLLSTWLSLDWNGVYHIGVMNDRSGTMLPLDLAKV